MVLDWQLQPSQRGLSARAFLWRKHGLTAEERRSPEGTALTQQHVSLSGFLRLLFDSIRRRELSSRAGIFWWSLRIAVNICHCAD